jgi:hypothetical protein
MSALANKRATASALHGFSGSAPVFIMLTKDIG